MMQLLYVSRSLIGADPAGLDRLMVQARTNNAIDGLTGLLWTDGNQFAQVVEGDERAVAELLRKLQSDRRHTDLRIVQHTPIEESQFGSWSMARPVHEGEATRYEERMVERLASIMSPLGTVVNSVIAGSRAYAR